MYIIKSDKTERFYIGHSRDPFRRLVRHNTRATMSTKQGIPWKIMYLEKFADRTSAIRREFQIKKMKSSNYIESLIKNSSDG